MATLNQTAGRGRLGRDWLESPGKGLAISTVVAPGPIPTLIPLIAGAALVDVLRARGVTAWMKWPNDVFVGSRKVAGILTEMPSSDRVIVGMGVNIRHQLGELPLDTATSLAAEGFDIDATDIADAWASNFRSRISSVGESTAVDWIEAHLGMLGETVAVDFPDGSRRTGVVRGITDNGALRLDAGDPVVAGDIVRLRPAD